MRLVSMQNKLVDDGKEYEDILTYCPVEGLCIRRREIPAWLIEKRKNKKR